MTASSTAAWLRSADWAAEFLKRHPTPQSVLADPVEHLVRCAGTVAESKYVGTPDAQVQRGAAADLAPLDENARRSGWSHAARLLSQPAVWRAVELVAAALLERGTVRADEVRGIVEGK